MLMLKKDVHFEVKENAQLMQFLLQSIKSKSRDNIKSLLRNKQIWINDKAVTQFNHPLVSGDQVEIRWARKSDLPPLRHLNIVFEDEHIIVIDKQAGLLSVSDGKEHLTAYGLLTEWVKHQDPANRVFIVHRLDQYTSGLLMFAKNDKVQNTFRNDWKSHITERTYTAVVEGNLKKQEGQVRSYLLENEALVMQSSQDPTKGKYAITTYKTLKSNPSYSLLQVNLETGRKNQIRVHMQDLGHSVAGDRKYGAKTNPVGRLCLHATVLAFTHPVTEKPLRFESTIPSEFLRLFQ
jgi:23S rRNA pseudouridine1911/1915/1917 synthase